MTDMTVEHAMQLADLLYSAGYDARHKERDYDPRGCGAWQDVVEALTAPRVDAERWRQAFVNERAGHYRADGMKVEQARIHAETDAVVAAIDLDADSMRGETS